MDDFLSDAGGKALQMAVRSSVSFASSYALKKLSRVLDDQINKTIVQVVESVHLPGSGGDKQGKTAKLQNVEEDIKLLKDLRDAVNYKIDIVLHTLDLIQELYKQEEIGPYHTHGSKSSDLIVKSCSKMIEPLVDEMNLLGDQVENFNTTTDFKKYMVKLSANIDSVIPYLTLCLNVVQSGRNAAGGSRDQSGTAMSSIKILDRDVMYSPSLLLQAAEVTNKLKNHQESEETGQDLEFETSMYTLVNFSPDAKVPVWKESIRRCFIKFSSVSPAHWSLKIKQSLNDGLYHDLEEDSQLEQTQEDILIENVEKSYYNSNSYLLNIGGAEEGTENDDVLVLKVRKYGEESKDEWVAFCKYSFSSSDSSDSESEADEDEKSAQPEQEDEEDDDFESFKEQDNRKQSIKLLQYVLGLFKYESCLPYDISGADEHLKMFLMGQYVLMPERTVSSRELHGVIEKVGELKI